MRNLLDTDPRKDLLIYLAGKHRARARRAYDAFHRARRARIDAERIEGNIRALDRYQGNIGRPR